MSQAFHMGCWWLGGRRGSDTGVQLTARMMRSASRKLRNRLATSRSCTGRHAVQFNVWYAAWSMQEEMQCIQIVRKDRG